MRNPILTEPSVHTSNGWRILLAILRRFKGSRMFYLEESKHWGRHKIVCKIIHKISHKIICKISRKIFCEIFHYIGHKILLKIIHNISNKIFHNIFCNIFCEIIHKIFYKKIHKISNKIVCEISFEIICKINCTIIHKIAHKKICKIVDEIVHKIIWKMTHEISHKNFYMIIFKFFYKIVYDSVYKIVCKSFCETDYLQDCLQDCMCHACSRVERMQVDVDFMQCALFQTNINKNYERGHQWKRTLVLGWYRGEKMRQHQRQLIGVNLAHDKHSTQALGWVCPRVYTLLKKKIAIFSWAVAAGSKGRTWTETAAMREV